MPAAASVRRNFASAGFRTSTGGRCSRTSPALTESSRSMLSAPALADEATFVDGG